MAEYGIVQNIMVDYGMGENCIIESRILEYNRVEYSMVEYSLVENALIERINLLVLL